MARHTTLVMDKPTDERTVQMIKEYLDGKTMVELSVTHGISAARIQQCFRMAVMRLRHTCMNDEEKEFSGPVKGGYQCEFARHMQKHPSFWKRFIPIMEKSIQEYQYDSRGNKHSDIPRLRKLKLFEEFLHTDDLDHFVAKKRMRLDSLSASVQVMIAEIKAKLPPHESIPPHKTNWIREVWREREYWKKHLELVQ